MALKDEIEVIKVNGDRRSYGTRDVRGFDYFFKALDCLRSFPLNADEFLCSSSLEPTTVEKTFLFLTICRTAV